MCSIAYRKRTRNSKQTRKQNLEDRFHRQLAVKFYKFLLYKFHTDYLDHPPESFNCDTF
jgi:hypothetical protein